MAGAPTLISFDIRGLQSYSVVCLCCPQNPMSDQQGTSMESSSIPILTLQGTILGRLMGHFVNISILQPKEWSESSSAHGRASAPDHADGSDRRHQFGSCLRSTNHTQPQRDKEYPVKVSKVPYQSSKWISTVGSRAFDARRK